jgi:FkbH-like protein
MEHFRQRLLDNPPQTLSQYIQACREILQEAVNCSVEPRPEMRIALVSPFTIRGLRETLFCQCLSEGIWTNIYEADYGVGFQQLLDPKSPLSRSLPNIIFLTQDLISLGGDAACIGAAEDADGFERWWQEKWDNLRSWLTGVLNTTQALFVCQSFELPSWTPFGILENKQKCGLVEAVDRLNHELRSFAKESPRLFVRDHRLFCQRFGADRMVDPKMYYLADARIRFELFPALAASWLPYIRAAASRTRKCLVLDLDNTLWGGVAGEDGINGIKLGPTPEGRPFWEFQKQILGLFRRGVLLAINSKNNPEDALAIIRHHPAMILREKHFAAARMNWEDKTGNLLSLAEELNIGLDSLVFLDDDPLNREMVRRAFPMVRVPDVPRDSSEYPRMLRNLTDFDSLTLTAEDLEKGRMYAEQRQRRELQQSSANLEHYLRGLNMTVTIESATAFSLPRLAQLTQKTNQFNMTSRRYQLTEIETFAAQKEWGVFSVQVADTFGDNGIVGAMIFRQEAEALRLDTFLLSCRVIGRRIEDVMLAFLVRQARLRQCRQLLGEFISTGKNIPARHFFETHGFQKISGEEQREQWVLADSADVETPEFITCLEKA